MCKGQTELPYLGHIVSKVGIKVEPKKIQTVANWPEPTNLNELQQFLGLTLFLRKYIQGNLSGSAGYGKRQPRV